MDTSLVILIIVLLVVFGVFLFTISGSSGSSSTGRVSGNAYPSQQYASGAGCGR